MMKVSGAIVALAIVGALAACSHSNKSHSSGNAGHGGSAGHMGNANLNAMPPPYISLPATNPEDTQRRAMEYCDAQDRMAVFRGLQAIKQQEMATYDCR